MTCSSQSLWPVIEWQVPEAGKLLIAGAATNSPARLHSTRCLPLPESFISPPLAISRAYSIRLLLPTWWLRAARQRPAILSPPTFCRSGRGTSAAAVLALLNYALSIKMSSNRLWEVGVEFQTCRSTPIRLPARGCSTLRRCRARAADGSSWEELVSLRLHWQPL